ncbi:3-phosphoshikimate 1-carboxyvinyltransferase [Brevibacterium sp. p3-SID960]|uniref:3-phosphoshikimate 1-carboxyvinyltransferase n=1 Tax=Brevibacterium sp. p3-SID960 TaxID=2916063 RepID=UPI0021A2E591|nr:3-phosphoshikimate 1-carboxyvinyltransferase [Brevibacterium sp. p3-SID960]MCT1691176.1 3-phosphoshikimate 1-carboxyvinyltransferase [Brevibacterium sp. p3-SID960]
MTQRDVSLWPAPRATAPVRATVAVPGSKSLTNRYIALAAVAAEPSTIINPLISRDTELMFAAITALGAEVDRSTDGQVTITPLPTTASGADAATVDCGLAGTVMRFIPPLAAATGRSVRIDGDAQAYVRPMDTMIEALRDLGVEITAGATSLPFDLRSPGGVPGGRVAIDASASSQFVSGLLLAGCLFDDGLTLVHTGQSVPSRPHIEMTLETMRLAGIDARATGADEWTVAPGRPRGFTVTVEPDLSNAATFLAAAIVTGGQVCVPHWPAETTQAGDAFRGLAAEFGAQVAFADGTLCVTGPEAVAAIDVDLSAVGELTPVTAAVAACAPGESRLRGIGHLRGHETDRLAALAAELGRLGAEVTEHADALTIHAPAGTGGRFETYHDHRMVMAAAVLGLRVDGVEILDVGTVAKTMPDFTQLWSGMLAGER